MAASGSSGEGECGGWAESVSALWELGGPAAAPTLTEVELGADAYLGELTRVAVTADGLRFRSIHDGTTRVHYATDYDEGECGC